MTRMTMRAMLLRRTGPAESGPLTCETVDAPEPGPGEIRLAVRCCGVCHTDLHTIEGELPPRPLPIIPGHQIVGIVDAAGAASIRFPLGTRVGVAWLNEACGACGFCRRGDENLCPSARFTGYDVPGGYADYVKIREDFAYALPAALPDDAVAPLLCAGIIGYRALRLTGLGRGQRLGLYGFGASAHLTLQVARYLGCDVYVFSRSEAHRTLARTLGARWCGRAEDEPPEKLDGAILFAPAGGLVPIALEHLGRGGTCALAGIHMSQIPPLDYEKHLYHERILRSVTASTRRDGRELLELAGTIPLRTHVTCFPLEEANRALQLLKQGLIDGAAVLRVAPDVAR